MFVREKNTYPRRHQRETLLKHTIFVVRARTGVAVVDADTLNVSSGGACIVTNSDQRPGNIMKIKLLFPGTDIQVPRLAEVRWVNPVKGKYKMGLQFLV